MSAPSRYPPPPDSAATPTQAWRGGKPRRRPLLAATHAAFWTLVALAMPAFALTTLAYFSIAPALLAQLSPFRLQYAVLLAALALFALLLRRRRWAALFAVFVAFNLWAALRSAVPPLLQATESAGAPLKILLANVLTSNPDPARLLALIAEEKPDVVGLLEVNRRWETQLRAALGADYPHVVYSPREDNFGLALLSREPLADSRLEFFADAELPSAAATVTLGDRSVRLLLTHPLPPGSALGVELRDKQLRELAGYARSLRPSQTGPSQSLVLFGDFNATPWCPPMRRLLADADLRLASAGHRWPGASWPANVGFLGIPIDHVLTDDTLACVAYRVGPDIGSDHFPVIAELRTAAPFPP